MSKLISLEKTFVNLIYPDQCRNCKLNGDVACKLEIKDCECVNFIEERGSSDD